jgi:hypothetical protein
MSGTLNLNLNCWAIGDDPRRMFEVEIGKTKSVSALKKLIKEEKQPAYNDITADSLDLWQVSEQSQSH